VGIELSLSVYIWNELITQTLDSVPQSQLFFFHALNQYPVTPRVGLQFVELLIDRPMPILHDG
jgi:hypothetical protein